jgi:hypothetical protein
MRLKFSFLFMLIVYVSGFIFSVPYIQNVSATSVTYGEGFESGVPSSDLTIGQSSSGKLYTKTYQGAFQVASGGRTGTRQIGGSNPMGWINFSYATDQLMSSFTIYVSYPSGSSYVWLCFYNSSTQFISGATGYPAYITQSMIHIQFNCDRKIYYYDEASNSHQFGYGNYSYVNGIKWTITDDTGNVDYQYNSNTVYHGVARDCTGIHNGKRIDRLFIKYQNSGNYYYDDISFTLGSTYGTGGGGIQESYCGYDVSQYASQIGNLYTLGTFSEKSSKNLSSNYGIPISTTIHGVGLAVDTNQYNADPNSANYLLEINGNDIGGAECFTPYTSIYGSFYILYWTCDVATSNETVTFRYEHDTISSYGWYWSVGQSAYSEDIDNDGDSYFQYEESSTTWAWEWVLLGGIFIPFYLPTTNTVTGVNADLGMTFWTGEISPPVIIDYNYTDTIGLSNWDYKNDTGYVYTIPDVASNGIVVSYTIASGNQADDYGILINFTNATESGYPYEVGDFTATSPIPYPDGVYSCIPMVEGKYEFCLYTIVGGGINFVGVNVTAWVVGDWANESYYIFTNPPTTYQFDGYSVVWKYDHPSDYAGAIAMFNEYYQYQENGFNGNYLSWDVADSPNENTQYYQSTGDSAEWLGLYAEKTNGYALTVPLHQHNIKLYGILENKIWVLPSTLAIPTADDVGDMGVVIYYQHRFVGTNIAIYIDGIYFQPVGDESSGSKGYIPYVAGTHTVELKLDQNGTLVTVASNTFRVTIAGQGGGGGGGGGGAGGGIIPTLAQPLGSIVGMIITIFCLLTPFIISGALHLQNGIHPVIYAMTGGLGLAISTIIGLFPIWIPLFVIVCGIIVIVIFYLRGATASSE